MIEANNVADERRVTVTATYLRDTAAN